MGNKLAKLCLIFLLILFVHVVSAQKKYQSKRWRLQFTNEMPKSIVITQPDGKKEQYWYVRYKVVNDTDRDIPWMINIRLVIDKVREGVAETKVPQIFFNARIPATIANKGEYLNNLKAYYDINLPMVKKAILQKLRIYPQFSKNEKSVLSALQRNKPKSIIEIMGEVGLSYEETEVCLTKLVVNNLAISQEITENPIFVKATLKSAKFIENDKEVNAKVGDRIAGWEVLSFSRNRVVMKKGDVVTKFNRGATLEYLYTKSDRRLVERDSLLVTGMAAKGVYKGRFPGKEGKHGKRYLFKSAVIARRSVRHGLAIFSNVSEEMDYFAVVVTGLVDPIVRRNRKIYVENEVFLSTYKRLGDEYLSDRDPVSAIERRWEVVSVKEFDRKTGKLKAVVVKKVDPDKINTPKDSSETKPKETTPKDTDEEWGEEGDDDDWGDDEEEDEW